MNLNKFIGREAILQNRWRVQTSDGQTHDVWVGLKSGLVGARVIAKVDDQVLHEKRVMLIAGRLTSFDLGGDAFTVRTTGLGLLGKLHLEQNGREVGQDMPVSEGNARDSTPPEQSEVVWDTRIEEAERVSEALGDEVRVIDNSRSSSDAERKITLTRQWTQSISLDMERATDLGGSVDAKLPFAIGFSASASQSIKRRYGVAEDVVRTYSEEVTIKVKQKTRSKITFSWRQVWQRGVVVGLDAEGREIRAPFEVKLHPTFDQMQEDVES